MIYNANNKKRIMCQHQIIGPVWRREFIKMETVTVLSHSSLLLSQLSTHQGNTGRSQGCHGNLDSHAPDESENESLESVHRYEPKYIILLHSWKRYHKGLELPSIDRPRDVEVPDIYMSFVKDGGNFVPFGVKLYRLRLPTAHESTLDLM